MGCSLLGSGRYEFLIALSSGEIGGDYAIDKMLNILQSINSQEKKGAGAGNASYRRKEI